jgi:alpha-1,3-rhamnosyl/mannosyltransferase
VAATPFSLQQQWQVPQVLRSLRPAKGRLIYHSPYYLMPYRPAVPTVVTVHDLIPLLFPQDVSARARLLFRASLRLALATAGHVIAVSESTRGDLLRHCGADPARVTAIWHAADPRFRPPSAAEKARVAHKLGLPPAYLLYFGSNKPHKNLVTLVEAYAGLPGGTIPLFIGGAWIQRHAEARQAVAELGLAERVRFLGPVDDADLPALYGGATAFAFPSRYEGFGFPVLEAMACGTPVIAGNASSLPEIAGDAALWVDPQDAGALRAALQAVLESEALRGRLARAGLARAAQFTWQSTATKTLAVYRELATEGTESHR